MILDEIKKASTDTLWELMTDLAAVLQKKKMDLDSESFMLWYRVYREIENEIGKRLNSDYDTDGMEG